MKINSKGAVTFSIRSSDKDLYDLIENLPSQVGSDMLREIIRDGLEYQKLVNNGTVSSSRLSMLCQLRRMELDEVISPFFGESLNESNMDAENGSENDNNISEKGKPTPKPKKAQTPIEVDPEDAFDAGFGEVTQY